MCASFEFRCAKGRVPFIPRAYVREVYANDKTTDEIVHPPRVCARELPAKARQSARPVPTPRDLRGAKIARKGP